MDVITFHYLVSLLVSEKLSMHLMDLDSEIYMKVSDGLSLPKSSDSKPRSAFAIKLRRSLYELKQSGRMWYNRQSDNLIGKRYKNDNLYPCVFIKRTSIRFAIVAIYVDDMNIIGNLKEIDDTVTYL